MEKTKLFEYHCYEGHDSQDAELWYHSHQKVSVGECENPEEAKFSLQERQENGCPLAFKVTFSNGFKSTAMEDELLDSKKEFYRPDPPSCKGNPR